MNESVVLSIIIPCKNEERTIARCLASAVREARNSGPAEIIVVDSLSQDQSVRLAGQFPVTIVQLRPSWPQSPAASRYIGCQQARGEYIFVLDADMELLPGFLSQAIEFLKTHPQAAAVAGMGREQYPDGDCREDLYQRRNLRREVLFVGGAALYKRRYLQEVGWFNPYLKSEEEAEVAMRLRAKGLKLYSVPWPMVIHFTEQTMDRFLYRLRAGYFVGIGQFLRVAMQRGSFVENVPRFKSVLLFWGTVGMLAGVNILIAQGDGRFLAYEAASLIALYAGVSIWKGDLQAGYESFCKWVLINISIFRGFFLKLPDAGTYPTDAVVLQKGELLAQR